MYFNGTHGGRFGVIFFFVLSGFLITYLMFIEKSKTGQFKLGHFYVRRALRIWPLYFFSLIIGFVLYPMAVSYSGFSHDENANLTWYSLFIANFDHIYHGFPTANILGVHWSVCVEEQFYLIWPILIIFLAKKGVNWIRNGVIAIFISSLLLSIIQTQISPIWAFYSLSTRAWQLAAGALIIFISNTIRSRSNTCKRC